MLTETVHLGEAHRVLLDLSEALGGVDQGRLGQPLLAVLVRVRVLVVGGLRILSTRPQRLHGLGVILVKVIQILLSLGVARPPRHSIHRLPRSASFLLVHLLYHGGGHMWIMRMHIWTSGVHPSGHPRSIGHHIHRLVAATHPMGIHCGGVSQPHLVGDSGDAQVTRDLETLGQTRVRVRGQ